MINQENPEEAFRAYETSLYTPASLTPTVTLLFAICNDNHDRHLEPSWYVLTYC